MLILARLLGFNFPFRTLLLIPREGGVCWIVFAWHIDILHQEIAGQCECRNLPELSFESECRGSAFCSCSEYCLCVYKCYHSVCMLVCRAQEPS